MAILLALPIGPFAAYTSDARAATANATNICEREMSRAADKYGVPLSVLYAVGLTESGQRQSLQPLAMNIEGRAYFAKSLDDALREFEAARADGLKLIDVGCMQIDFHWHGDQFASVKAMFDPKANVDYGARLLSGLKKQEGSWTMAVARYHAGPNNDPAQKRYVCTVIRNMVATGFGAWTDAARDFCGEPGR